MQSKYLTLLHIALLLVIISACENEIVDDYEPELNVLSVLNDMTSIQTVYVDRTYSMYDTAGGLIEDALVIMSAGSYVDTLDFIHETGMYWTDAFNIVPLATYELTVIKEGFDTLTGTTTVPASFVIIHPAFNDTISFQDTIVFAKSEKAGVYGCVLRHEMINFATFFYHEPDPLDSIIQLPIGEHLESAPPGRYVIYISAYDSNFYEYHFGLGDSILQAGVTGGVGCFGSIRTEGTVAYILAD